MSKVRQMLLDTALNRAVGTCPAHGELVKVLLALDARLLRLEVILVVTCLAALGTAAKSVLLPLALGALGG
jgi:hypothetical protein